MTAREWFIYWSQDVAGEAVDVVEVSACGDSCKEEEDFEHTVFQEIVGTLRWVLVLCLG